MHMNKKLKQLLYLTLFLSLPFTMGLDCHNKSDDNTLENILILQNSLGDEYIEIKLERNGVELINESFTENKPDESSSVNDPWLHGEYLSDSQYTLININANYNDEIPDPHYEIYGTIGFPGKGVIPESAYVLIYIWESDSYQKYDNSGLQPGNITITMHGGFGNRIVGSFEAEVKNTASDNTYTASGSFSVEME